VVNHGGGHRLAFTRAHTTAYGASLEWIRFSGVKCRAGICVVEASESLQCRWMQAQAWRSRDAVSRRDTTRWAEWFLFSGDAADGTDGKPI